MIKLPDELEDLKRFHGHLGPYVVVGYKMGLIGREVFPDKISAVIYTGTKRPLSCIIDGVQFSSCCTLGKGNVAVREDGVAKTEFYDENKLLEITLFENVRSRIDATVTSDNEEMIAFDLFTADPSDLFRITEGESTQSGRVVKLK